MSDNQNSDDIKNRIKDLKSRYEQDTTPSRPKNQDMGAGLRIATDLVASVLVGLFIGYSLDSFFETKPIFLLIFLILGMVAGLLNVIRTAKRLDNQSRK